MDLSRLALENDSKLMLSLKPMQNFDRQGCVEFNQKNQVNVVTLDEKFFFESFMEESFKTLSVSMSVFNRYFIDNGIPVDYHQM